MGENNWFDELCDGLFGAAEAGDWDRFRAAFADSASLRQNIGAELPINDALSGLTALMSGGMQVRYTNVRRFSGARSGTELHDAVFTKPDGQTVTLDICVVIAVDDEGLITEAHEYLDSGAAMALIS